MLRHQLAVAERERPRAHSRLTWPDRAWLALLAGTVPAERLAAMRLIVTPGTILRCQRDIVRRPTRHDPAQPEVSGQQSRERGDHGSVHPVQLRTGDLTAQDRDLVPQYQDLHLFGGVAAGEQRQPAEQPRHQQAEEAEEHERRG